MHSRFALFSAGDGAGERNSFLAEETGMPRHGVQKALFGDGNPRFESIDAIMHAMGYRLTLEKLDMSVS